MRRLIIVALLIAAAFLIEPAMPARGSATAARQLVSTLAMFENEAAAQAHCRRDVVVWLNIPTGICHEKGMRWYGRTKHGAYVCKKEADAAGDRDTRNG